MLALPTIALFGMGQLRLMAIIGAIAEVILIGVLLVPRKPSTYQFLPQKKNLLTLLVQSGDVILSNIRHFK